PVALQEALDEGLHVIDGEAGTEAEGLLSLRADGAHDDAGTAVHTPLFEMEPVTPAAEAYPPAAIAVAAADAPADGLDFQVLDRELVDIFVEEGKDLLDHCDGLVSELRDAPEDREILGGLQRDLHTLKGG